MAASSTSLKNVPDANIDPHGLGAGCPMPALVCDIPGDDDVELIASPAKVIGVGAFESLDDHARAGRAASVTGAKSWTVRCLRVTPSVDAVQLQDQEQGHDEAVECLTSRGPNMTISPGEEQAGRAKALDAAVNSAVTSGLFRDMVGALRGISARRSSAFRRGERDIPPAKVTLLTAIH